MTANPLALFLAVGMLSFAESAFAAEVIEVHHGNVDLLPGGREADGIVGDFVLRNDRIEAVIAHNAPHRRANMGTFYGSGGQTPGCLYDLTFRDEDNDQMTVFSPCNQRGEVSWVKAIETERADEAAVEVVVTAAKRGGVAVRHEYRVRDGMNGLFITTTFSNELERDSEVLVRDLWTRFENQGIFGAYHWADAVDPSYLCGYAFGWLSPAEKTVKDAKLPILAGETITIQRFLAVGYSPAEAVGYLAVQLKEAGTLSLLVADEAGEAVNDAVVGVEMSSRTRIPAYPKPDGSVEIPFLKGDYQLSVSAPGRESVSAKVEVSESPAPAVVRLKSFSAVSFSVTDSEGNAIPCKVQFHGLNGTSNPNLGPTMRAAGCADQWHSAKGNFQVKLRSGEYRVVVTHGPEYGHFEQRITLGVGEIVDVEARLERQVDTTGWVSADFHNHSTPSGDNVCGTDDRIINLAAEQLEFAPTTEHNRIYDWTPHIERLGLSAHLSTIPGIELTGRGAHINAFPLTPVPRTQDGGAPVWENDPRINMHRLRNLGGWQPNRWTQVNHPDMSENFVDRNKDGEADGGFTQLAAFCDGLETQNYRTSNILQTAPFRLRDPLAKGSRIDHFREFVWLQLLNQGSRVWAVAVADAHTVYGNGVGSWRTYLPSSTDSPGQIDWEEIVRNARSGHMILSSGPFMKLDFGEGVLPGQTITGRKSLQLGIQIQCADWYDVDRVQVLVNGRQDPELNFTAESHPDWFREGVVRFDQKIDLTLEEDSHLIVVGIGENSTLEKGFGTSTQRIIQPCVYNNPIFVDVDGDGFKPNGDTLGYPLPVGGLSPDEAKKILESQ
ncbi:MAG: CehA/McbA family metallohydrolase [Verrucomicrobiota bacterium]